MLCKPDYPEDFKHAFQRTSMKGRELEELCAGSSYPPLFVYDHLMLPTVLKYATGIPQSTKVDMVRATLPGYELWHFSKGDEPGLPIMRPSWSPADVVEGMLVFGLTREQRSDSFDFVGARNKQLVLENVTVQVSVVDRAGGCNVKYQKPIDAGAFTWDSKEDGLWVMKKKFWPIDEFISGERYKHVVRLQNSAQGGEYLN